METMETAQEIKGMQFKARVSKIDNRTTQKDVPPEWLGQ